MTFIRCVRDLEDDSCLREEVKGCGALEAGQTYPHRWTAVTWIETEDRYSCLSSKDGSDTGDIYGLKVTFWAFFYRDWEDIPDLPAVEQESFCCLKIWHLCCGTGMQWRLIHMWGERRALCLVRRNVAFLDSEYWDTVRWVLWLVTVRKLEMAGWNTPVAFWGRVELEAPTSASHSTFCCVAWERTDCTAIPLEIINRWRWSMIHPKKLFQRSMALIASLLLEFLKRPPARCRCVHFCSEGFFVFLHLHRFHCCVAISLAGLVKDSSQKNL